MTLRTGQILNGRYRIMEQLGNGLAKTYAAQDTTEDSAVIIKALRFSELDNWKGYELFQREIKVLQQLRHPSIPRFKSHFEVKTEEETWLYLVQERLPGKNLQQAMDSGWRPAQKEVKQLATKALGVLKYLHQLSPPVIHRDLKPSNLIWHDQRLYLIDFGAVQDVMRPEGSSTIVGTFGYMAPEQFSGRAVPASDLYALGATLVHLLSGRAPSDIPQRALKLDFEDYVHADAHFISWLHGLLEPIVETRIPSATEALHLLQTPALPTQQVQSPLTQNTFAQAVPQPASLTVEKPASTQIKLSKSKNQLVIKIPRHVTRKNIPLALLVYTLAFGVAFLLGAQIVSVFLLVTAPLFMWMSYPLFKSYSLVFNEKNLLVQSTIFSPRKEIFPLSSVQNFKPEISSWRGYLDLITSKKNLKIGSSLDLAEREWLKSEILKHLEKHSSQNQKSIE